MTEAHDADLAFVVGGALLVAAAAAAATRPAIRQLRAGDSAVRVPDRIEEAEVSRA